MTFSCFRWLILLAPLFLSAQVDEFLAQPTLNLSLQKGSRWGFNTAVSQRSLIINENRGLHVQAAQFVTYEVGFYAQIGAGVMYRELFDNDRPEELRFTQQYVYSKKYNVLKVAHRLRWDQRIRADRLTHRWRYRLSSSIPLNGTRTDVREFYLTGSLETVFIAEADVAPAYDQRFAAGIGTQLFDKVKVQVVAEYRFEDFTVQTEQLLFFNLGIYYKP
jgi:hypothetical protein